MTFKLWSVGSSRSHEAHETPPPVWRLMSFEDLRVGELYEALRLRSEVFVVEQQCVFQDIDGADREAMHLLGVQGGELTAYARCFEAGAKFPEASIGRVAVRKSARGTGLGHLLMAQAVAAISQVWGPQAIRIGAQTQLQAFYVKHGFKDVGTYYLEDGIPHLEMLREA
ncbi:GNAT family N-acetyltransferase [Rhodoferax sp.]|uniref:GNAT family N-acetyltransferase n=1 Tax=Rhodoferax sp. TaxID=50421 RepID=UPI0027172E4E|nr:GNAT family N-acetyltransferase [Rhodoferax sp.]MDO9143359.1 GNAT family N-acetyltransferase [Rhodoferax sp.]MDP1530269.1 GNAT family N-acetyltransferase [Rhodoferax sp.]MDP1943384.1 GNAT family N-acetyltransferase [Rhodoferax sp.]MDP2442637.1 GNAT family N-acetyltransferase [Rhodoferax sp.]MDP3192837.1 GNAT family N-acetyltransferase [Rhodoferax sp.]